MSDNYIANAFQQLDSLTEDVFELNDDGIEKLVAFEEEPIEDEIVVTDLDAETEEDLEDSYIGKVILDCDICHSKLYKDRDEVIIDEETQMANVDEECPYCTSVSGYKIVGEIAEFKKDEHKDEADHDNEEDHKDDEEVEVKEEEKTTVESKKFQESLKRARTRKAGVKRVVEAKTSQRDRIDARRDDRVEKAKRAFDKARDDADSDRDYRLKKAGLKEYFVIPDEKKEYEFIKKTKQGFDIVKVFVDKSDNRMHIIAHRPRLDDYLIGLGYDPTDGTWGQGRYDFSSMEKAEAALRRDYDVRPYGNAIKEGNGEYLANARKFAKEIEDMDEETAKNWYYKEYAFDKKGPVDRAERAIYRALRKKLGLEESKCITEKDKRAALSVEDAQKWVDYDMKRYGKISDRTNRLVRKAGFQIIKDQYGDYEVAAGKYESKEMNEAPIYGLTPEYDGRKSFGGKANVEIDGYGTETLYSYDTPVARFTKEGTLELLPKWDLSQTTLRHVKEFLRQHGLKADSLAQIKKDYLKEDFERVDIETDKEKMSMTADEDGKVTVVTEPKKEEEHTEEEEVIVPVDDETKETIEDDSIEVDIDDFEEETFDELGESYLKKVYDNVNSYKTTKALASDHGMKLEGLITFNSGKTKKTAFVFEAKEASKDNKVKFIGENLEITRGKKAFTLIGSVQDKKLVSESLNYNYRAKDGNGKSQRVYGTIKK